MQENSRTFVPEIVDVLIRRKRAIGVVWLSAIVAAILFLLLASPTYTATTKIIVNIGREKFEPLQMQAEPIANLMVQQRDNDANNEVELLESPALIQQVAVPLRQKLEAEPTNRPSEGTSKSWMESVRLQIKEQKRRARQLLKQQMAELEGPLVALHLVRRLNPDQEFALKIERAFDVSHIKETDVIVLEFSWDDPESAATALNMLIEAYQNKRIQVFEEKHSVGFYGDEVKTSEAELADLESKLNEFLREGGISNLEAEKTLLLNQLADSRQEAERLRTDIENVRMKLANIQRTYQGSQAWIETPDAADAVAGTQALDERFVQLLAERNSLLARLLPDAYQVKNVDAQLTELRQQKYNSLQSFYHVRATTLSDKLERLKADIQAKQDQLADLTARTTQYEHLQQRRALLTAQVDDYRKKVESLRINDELNANAFTSIHLVGPAQPPPMPSFPKPSLILPLAAAFGLLAGIAFAVMQDLLGGTIGQPKQIERILRIPLLATIPESPA